MNSLDIIRTNIQKLYEIDPHIHINVSLSKPKVLLENQPVVITGVYPHIFQIEERSSGSRKTYTLQYTEVLLKHIEIVELS